jgi:hypothetical protein
VDSGTGINENVVNGIVSELAGRGFYV